MSKINTYNFLSTRKIFVSKAKGLLTNLFTLTTEITSEAKSELKVIKNLTPKESHKERKVQLIVDKHKKTVVRKSFRFRFKTLDYSYILNEGSVLNVLSKVKSTSVRIPKLYGVKEGKDFVEIESEYVHGEIIQGRSTKEILFSLEKTLDFMKESYQQIPQNVKSRLMRKTNSYFFLSLPYLALKGFIKYPHLFPYIFGQLANFYKLQLTNNLFIETLVLSHTELHADSILYDKKLNKVAVLDWEGCVIADKFYDLSLISRYYLRILSRKDLETFLGMYISSRKDLNKFKSLSIYNCIDFLANNASKKDISFANRYLKFVENYYTSKRTTFSKSVKKVAICYHSVSNSKWEYATPKELFSKQINFFLKNNKILSPSQFFNSNEGGVLLTFDDGYKSVLTEALPFLRKNNIKPLLFVLGNKDDVKREELENSEELLNIEEIKKLHKLGWEIGYHSNSHANLIDLGNKELKREIVDGKENLEEKLGFELKYFSYPKGKYNQKVVNMVMGAGFDAAFTVEAGPIGNKKYLLPRFQIEKLDNMNILALKLSLPGLFLERAVSNFFRIKEQMHVRFS